MEDRVDPDDPERRQDPDPYEQLVVPAQPLPQGPDPAEQPPLGLLLRRLGGRRAGELHREVHGALRSNRGSRYRATTSATMFPLRTSITRRNTITWYRFPVWMFVVCEKPKPVLATWVSSPSN